LDINFPEGILIMHKAVGSEKVLPRVLIADDHLMFAQVLRDSLQGSYNIVGVVADGRTMVSEAMKLEPDLILADISMPLLNGLDAARRIREQAPKVRFVFLTMQEDPNLAAAALELGVVGFVLKHGDEAELLKALELVLQGKSYVTPKLRAEDWAEAKVRAQQFSKDMTPRQRDVLQLLAEGRPMKEVADVLSLSRKTIDFHKRKLMKAFNLKNNADLVLFAMRHGLISVNPEPASQTKKRPERD
jgi:DNA-binding NarL/FixJ family response regulator